MPKSKWPKEPTEDEKKTFSYKLGLSDRQIVDRYKKAWSGINSDVKSAGKAIGKVASIAADTVGMSAKEVASGKAGQRILIDPATKAGKTVYRHGKGIWDVVSEEAKKKFDSLVKAGKKPVDKVAQAAKDAELRKPKISAPAGEPETAGDKAALDNVFWGENMPKKGKKK